MLQTHITDWFHNAGWGVFCHYLGAPASSAGGKELTADDWNRQVDNFDVVRLASQLERTGTKYFFITIGQNSGHYCAPNETYDSIVGIKPSKCSRRDLISDLYDVLSPKGIKLMVYLPSGAPAADVDAMKRLEWEWGFEGPWPTNWNGKRTGKRLISFQRKWEAIIREWSLRWGEKICGWWIDGCYFADEMYRFSDEPNFKSFSAALKAGNPNSIIAFNPGVLVPIIRHTEYEDFTAGEISNAFPVCPGRWVENAQYHILSYLGNSWGQGEPRFCDEFVVGYTKDVISKGGVITWDVPIQKNGLIPEVFIKQLTLLRNL
jgi:alpha-L-fucosidase